MRVFYFNKKDIFKSVPSYFFTMVQCVYDKKKFISQMRSDYVTKYYSNMIFNAVTHSNHAVWS